MAVVDYMRVDSRDMVGTVDTVSQWTRCHGDTVGKGGSRGHNQARKGAPRNAFVQERWNRLHCAECRYGMQAATKMFKKKYVCK